MLLSLCFTPIAAAQSTWYVDDDTCDEWGNGGNGTEENPFCRIQAGIDRAGNGNEVIVLDGTYLVYDTGVDGRRRLWFGSPARQITLRSQNGPEDCTIDCEGSSQDECRVFDFYKDDAERSTVVEGFTIKGAYVTSWTAVGGGIRCVESQPIIRGCVIEGNFAPLGGGIAFWGDPEKDPPWNPLVQDCTIRDNEALASHGGGVYCYHHIDVDVENCLIVGNTTPHHGGGIFWGDGSDLEIVGCTIVGNMAGSDGGGLYGIWKDTLPTRPTLIKRCTIVRNWVENGSGGGVTVASSQNVQMWMVNNVVAGNEGRGQGSKGGGLALFGWGTLFESPWVLLVNDLFAGNVAHEGGGIFTDGYLRPEAEMAHCTVVGNVANSVGGGIRRGHMQDDGNRFDLSNIIVRGNVPSDNQVSEYLADSFRIRYSDVIGVVATTWDGGHNISDDPLFAGGVSDTWTSDAVYDVGEARTTLYDANAEWTEGELVGKLLNPDTNQYLQSVIVANTDKTMTVWGDFEELGQSSMPYQVNDYRLTGISPCIDAANNQLVQEDKADLDEDENTTEPTPRDIVMGPRHLDAELVVDTGCCSAPIVDMGAYEFAGEIDDDDCQPPRGVIDARQPHPVDDCSLAERQGFGYGDDLITIAFDPPIADAEDLQFWSLSESGIERQDWLCPEPDLEPNEIVSVSYLGGGDYEIELERPISAGFVTTISLGQDHSAIYASLPADVNSDCTSAPSDILGVIDCLNNVVTCEIWQCDVDRSGVCGPPDILRVIDLLNGALMYIAWNNEHLDPNICQGGRESAGSGVTSSPGVALTGVEASAEFMDGFVEFLTTSVTRDAESKEDFKLISDALARFCVDNLLPCERASLAERLQDPSLKFESPVAEEMVPEIVKTLLE